MAPTHHPGRPSHKPTTKHKAAAAKLRRGKKK